MDTLLDSLMGFAVQMIETHGEFFPFAGMLTADGEVEHVVADVDDERPPSEEVLQLLETRLRETKSELIRAVAHAVDMRLTDPTTDAIRIHVEHRHGDAVDVFLPYEKKRLRGVKFGELFATPSERILAQ